jgi:hypothetical protein
VLSTLHVASFQGTAAQRCLRLSVLVSNLACRSRVSRSITLAFFLCINAGPDRSGDWVESLLHGPLQHDALPTTHEQIKACLSYRGTQKHMLVPVTSKYHHRIVYTDQKLATATLACTDDSDISVQMTSILSKAPKDHDSELTTTVAVSHYIDTVFDSFTQYGEAKLAYRCSLNCSERFTTSSCVQGRPDTVIVVNGCTFLIGEDKQAGNMVGAIADLKNKVKGLNIHHYGPVQFLLAYAAAGLEVRFYSVSANGTQVQACHT